jgi:hypothetical protein
MKTVLARIVHRKRDDARLAFFDFLRDDRIAPRDRFAFFPMATFVMDFGDFNRHLLRDDASGDPHQRMLDEHSREDDHHWPWYLEDFVKLGFDADVPASESMRFLWSDAFARNRMLSHRLAHLVWLASPAVRLAVVEAIEETGNVLLALTAKLAKKVEPQIGHELRDLGDIHFALESGHATNNDHAELAAIELSDAERATRCAGSRRCSNCSKAGPTSCWPTRASASARTRRRRPPDIGWRRHDADPGAGVAPLSGSSARRSPAGSAAGSAAPPRRARTIRRSASASTCAGRGRTGSTTRRARRSSAPIVTIDDTPA